MSTLSTHVLDLTHGRPAGGMGVRLTRDDAVLFQGVTNADGRCPELPIIEAGRYRLAFEVANYFRAAAVVLPEPPFLDVVPIAFGVEEGGGHYHVPLLVSPFGYSTYRGS